MKRMILTIILLILVFTMMWGIANRKHLASFPVILSSYYSKEYCSCRFVVERTKDQCHESVRSWLDISDFKEDTENKSITVSGLGQTNTAQYINSRYGCILK